MASEQDVRARLQRAGQEHLLRFCAELAPGPRAALLAELARLEPEALREHCRRAALACARSPGRPPGLAERLRPLPPARVGSAIRGDPEALRLWEEEGRRGESPGRGAPLGGRKGPSHQGGLRGGACWLAELQCASFVTSPLRHAPARGRGREPSKRCGAGSRPQAAFPRESGLYVRTPDGQCPAHGRGDSRGPLALLHMLLHTSAGALRASRPGGEAGAPRGEPAQAPRCAAGRNGRRDTGESEQSDPKFLQGPGWE